MLIRTRPGLTGLPGLRGLPALVTHVALMALLAAAAAPLPFLPGPSPAAAQRPGADSIAANPNGTWSVWIGGVHHIALGDDALRRIRIRADSLSAALAALAELERIVRAREAEVAALERQVASAEALLAAQDRQIATQERLIDELRRLSGRRVGLELGAGADREYGLAGLAGLTWDRWGIWALWPLGGAATPAATAAPAAAGVKFTLARF